MRFIKKLLLILPVFLINIVPNIGEAGNESDVVVLLPRSEWQEDVNIKNTQVQTNGSTIFVYIQIINKYLWFSIAGVSMFILIVAGLKLITAGGKDGKKAGVLALSCIIAITVAMFSYVLVNLIVNLF